MQIILIISLICSGSTLAFLTVTKSVTNRFITGEADVSVVEPNVSDTNNVEWGNNSKNVYLSLPKDSGKAYVRAMIVVSLKDTNSAVIDANLGTLSAPDANGILVVGDFTLHFNEDWENEWGYKDGYFYHFTALESEEETGLLLKGITLTNDTAENSKKYGGIKVVVDVLSDSIQASSDAYKQWGISIDSDGKIVLP